MFHRDIIMTIITDIDYENFLKQMDMEEFYEKESCYKWQRSTN